MVSKIPIATFRNNVIWKAHASLDVPKKEKKFSIIGTNFLTVKYWS